MPKYLKLNIETFQYSIETYLIQMDEFYLFSEDIFSYQNGYIREEKQTNKPLIKVSNFKIICFINRLDLYKFPFITTPIESPGESCYLYKYHFSSISTLLDTLGFHTQKTPQGTVIYLSNSVYQQLSIDSPIIDIKGPEWPSLYQRYNEIAAFYHLGLISSLSVPTFKNNSIYKSAISKFHHYFDNNSEKSTLKDLFIEILQLLAFFGLGSPNIPVPSSNSNFFSFGDLIPCFQKYTKFAHPHFNCGGISFAAIQELRLLYQLVNYSFDALDYLQHETNINSALSKFQKKNNLPQSGCDQQTIKLLLLRCFSVVEDPVKYLKKCGINIHLFAQNYSYNNFSSNQSAEFFSEISPSESNSSLVPNQIQNPILNQTRNPILNQTQNPIFNQTQTNSSNLKFGNIISLNSNDEERKIASILSNITKDIPAPIRALVDTRERLLKITSDTFDKIDDTKNVYTNSAQKIEETNQNITKLANHFDEITHKLKILFKTIDQLTAMNNGAKLKIENLNDDMEREIKIGSFYMIVLLLIILFLFLKFLFDHFVTKVK